MAEIEAWCVNGCGSGTSCPECDWRCDECVEAGFQRERDEYREKLITADHEIGVLRSLIDTLISERDHTKEYREACETARKMLKAGGVDGY